MPHPTWPASPLAAAGRAFDLLVQAPSRLLFDGRGCDGLPDETLSLPRLRALLLTPGTSSRTRDAVWRDLVGRARNDGPGWVIGAVGIALPGLRRAARQLTAGWPGDTSDLDAETLTGFVERLRSIDLVPPRICGRLIDAGVRAARKARLDAVGPTAPAHPWGHPDLVLAQVVAAGVLDADEADLIATTRLDEASLVDAAAAMGITASQASSWRRGPNADSWRRSATVQQMPAIILAAGPRHPLRRRPGVDGPADDFCRR